MVGRIWKCQFIATTSCLSFHCSPSMIGVKVGKENIRYIPRFISPVQQALRKSFPSVQLNMTEEFLILLISPSCIDKNNMSIGFNYQRPESKNNQVILI